MPALLSAVEAAFTALARLRAARGVHPSGALFAGRVELDAPASPTVAVLGATIHPALVRVSKGAGTRGRLPDLLGLAVRLTDLPDGPVDLLYSTVGRHRCTGALLAPASGWCTRPYSTLLPYRADGERVTLGLWPQQPDRAHGADPQVAREAVRQEPLVLAVMEKRARAPWAPIGRLVLDLPMPDGAADDGPHGADPVMGRTCGYGLGFMLGLGEHDFGTRVGDGAFGHSGFRGMTAAFADPAHGLVVTCHLNGSVDPGSLGYRRPALVDTIYRAVVDP